MEKRRKIEERIWIYGREFSSFLHKKASFPSGCLKKLCPRCRKSQPMPHIASRLAPGGQSFFITTQ